jgi:hypothetical protein
VPADPQIAVSPTDTAVIAPAPRLNPDLTGKMRTLSQNFWPGLPIIPTMAVGGTHGLNERLSVKSFYDGQRFLDELTRVVAE